MAARATGMAAPSGWLAPEARLPLGGTTKQGACATHALWLNEHESPTTAGVQRLGTEILLSSLRAPLSAALCADGHLI